MTGTQQKGDGRFLVSHDNNKTTIVLAQLDDYLSDIMAFPERQVRSIKKHLCFYICQNPGI